MNAEQIKTLYEIVEEAQKRYDLVLTDFIDDGRLEEIENIDELKDYFEDELNENREVTDEDVIYYYDAMKYLMENDQTLTKSLEIAGEFGYSPEDIDSCTLASLLKTRNNEENYSSCVNKIIDQSEEIFNDE